jgi:type IV secretory pathway VirB10-like protein
MESSTRSFFAGVGTTFVILGLGFGGGLLMADSALKQPDNYQKNRVEQASPVRVILPTTAEAAQAPTPPSQQVSAVEPTPSPEPVKMASPEKNIEKVDTKSERRKRYAERKARRDAARARQIERREPQEPRILAFGSDEPRHTSGFGFFGKN